MALERTQQACISTSTYTLHNIYNPGVRIYTHHLIYMVPWYIVYVKEYSLRPNLSVLLSLFVCPKKVSFYI